MTLFETIETPFRRRIQALSSVRLITNDLFEIPKHKGPKDFVLKTHFLNPHSFRWEAAQVSHLWQMLSSLQHTSQPYQRWVSCGSNLALKTTLLQLQTKIVRKSWKLFRKCLVIVCANNTFSPQVTQGRSVTSVSGVAGPSPAETTSELTSECTQVKHTTKW